MPQINLTATICDLLLLDTFNRKSITVCVCLCLQTQDGRFEVRGRHGKSVLTISGVRLTDLGRFDCEALSRIGGHQKSMFLDIECEYCLIGV